MKNTRTDKIKVARPGRGVVRLTIAIPKPIAGRGEMSMASLNLYGEKLLRFLRVAEDLQVAERLGVSKMDGARILLQISQDESILKSESTKAPSELRERRSSAAPPEDCRQLSLIL
jgi:hypothetical protein